MVEIVDNKWRAFLKLTSVRKEWNAEQNKDVIVSDGYIYFDVNSHPTLVRIEGDAAFTRVGLPYMDVLYVKETPEEITKAADEMISVEQDKKAKQAEEYYAEMMKAKKAGDK